MTITLHGTVVNGVIVSDTATFTLSATPTNGDRMVVVACSLPTPAMVSPGFTADASQGSVMIFSKVASGEGTSFSCNNISGTGAGAWMMVFTATTGFKTAAEQALTGTSGSPVSTMTVDPAGVPSGAESVSVAGFKFGTAIGTLTIAWNGGSAATPTSPGSRAAADYKIVASAPADLKTIWTSSNSDFAGAAMVSYVEGVDTAGYPKVIMI